MIDRFDLFVFDLDGTLIDSAQDIANAANTARGSFDLPPLPMPTIKNYVGRGVVRLLKDVFETDDPTTLNKALQVFFQCYEANCLEHTKLYPSVIDLLQKIENKKLAVLTNKPKIFSDKIVQGLKIDHFFSHVMGGDSFQSKKPDPEGLLWLLDALKVPRHRALFVGDSGVDCETGKRAQVPTALLAQGFSERAELEKMKPDFLFPNIAEMKNALEKR